MDSKIPVEALGSGTVEVKVNLKEVGLANLEGLDMEKKKATMSFEMPTPQPEPIKEEVPVATPNEQPEPVTATPNIFDQNNVDATIEPEVSQNQPEIPVMEESQEQRVFENPNGNSEPVIKQETPKISEPLSNEIEQQNEIVEAINKLTEAVQMNTKLLTQICVDNNEYQKAIDEITTNTMKVG